MYQSGTQRLIDTWRNLPQANRVPYRSDLDPVALGRHLTQAFVLDRDGWRLPVRLAGGLVEQYHGVVTGHDWLSLWQDPYRASLSAAVMRTAHEARPLVVHTRAHGLVGPLEITLAPLRGANGQIDRLLGLYQWTHEADRHAEDVSNLVPLGLVPVGSAGRAHLTLAATGGRRIA